MSRGDHVPSLHSEPALNPPSGPGLPLEGIRKSRGKGTSRGMGNSEGSGGSCPPPSPPTHSVVLKASHLPLICRVPGRLAGARVSVCLSVCRFNTDSQMNSVLGMGVGSLSRPLPASQGPTLAIGGLLGQEAPEGLLGCGGVGSRWLRGGGSRGLTGGRARCRADRQPHLLAFPFPSPNYPSSSQKPCP